MNTNHIKHQLARLRYLLFVIYHLINVMRICGAIIELYKGFNHVVHILYVKILINM